MQHLQILLFGPPRLELDGQAVPINRRKMLALLAYLAVTRQPHSREALASQFWPEFDSSSALANLRRDLSRLKEILGEGCLLIEREKVQLNPEAAAWVDTARFETLIREAELHGHLGPGQPGPGAQDTPPCAYCQGLLEEAAGLYTGAFMAGFNLPDSPAFDEWQYFQTERLRGMLAGVLSQLARWCIAQGAYEGALEHAARWLALDPLHEPAQRLVMQLRAWVGQPSAALRQYHGLVEQLEKELGAQPEGETTALYEAIRARKVAPPEPARPNKAQAPEKERERTPRGMRADASRPEAAEGTRLLVLPTQLTPLIGREKELLQLRDLLANPDCRLVTFVGTGGVGKTRLAIETAARTAGTYPNGVVFVPLASITEPGHLLQAIASAVRIRYSPGADPKDQLLRQLSERKMLLVLDNFEQLRGAAELLTEMLAAAPGLRLLVTSRERLNIMEEWIYELQGLPFPAEGEPIPTTGISSGTGIATGASISSGAGISSGAEEASWLGNFGAVQLFIERARRVMPDLQIDETSLLEIARICRLVEGMPLALELAAPWVRSMSTADIARELEQGLDVLTTSLRNLPERHRSIRVIFNQSWESLSPVERAALARLSVFRGGCTREAAEQVAGAHRPDLTGLVDKALLRYRANRYEMHELVRQYAAERLAEFPPQQEAAFDQHYRYYLELLEQVTPWLKGGRQIEASIKINTDIDNIRAAWRRAVRQRDFDSLARAAEAYWLFHEFGGFLAQGEAAFRLAAEAATAAIAGSASDLDEALQGMGSPGRMPGLHRAEAVPAAASQGTGSPGKMPGLHRAGAVQDANAEGAGRYIGYAGFFCAAQGSLLARQWQFEQGRRLMEQGLSLLRAASPQDPEKTAFALTWLSFLDVMHGQYPESARTAEESLAFFPHTGDRWTQAGALRLIGAASLYQGQLQKAQEHLDRCVEVCKSIGELRIRTYATSNLGVIYLWYGQIERARQYFDESLRISKSCNDRLARADALCERGRLFIATGEFDLAVETARSCIHLYQELGRPRASLANIILGKSLRLLGAEGAEAAMREGLEEARAVDHRPDIASAFEGMGALALDRQEYEQAEQYFRQSIEIWEAIGHEPEVAFLLCRSSAGLLASGATDTGRILRTQRVRAQLLRALRLARKHQTATTAISALAGLEALRVLAGGPEQRTAGEKLLAYAFHHPATTYEVRRWIQQFMLGTGLPDPATIDTTEINKIGWQTLAEEYEPRNTRNTRKI